MCTLKKLKLNLWLNLDYAPMTKIKKAEILTWQGKNTQSSICYSWLKAIKEGTFWVLSILAEWTYFLSFCIFSTHGGS